MEFKIENNNNDYLIIPNGKLDFDTSEEFDKVMKKVLVDAKSITIDMKNVQYISSAGIRVIVCALNEFEEKGELKIKNVNAIVKDILEMTALEYLIV